MNTDRDKDAAVPRPEGAAAPAAASPAVSPADGNAAAADAVRERSEDVCAELMRLLAESGKPYQIEISIGCARLEPDIATVHDLIDKADQEMYHLKTRKRGTS